MVGPELAPDLDPCELDLAFDLGLAHVQASDLELVLGLAFGLEGPDHALAFDLVPASDLAFDHELASVQASDLELAFDPFAVVVVVVVVLGNEAPAVVEHVVVVDSILVK